MASTTLSSLPPPAAPPTSALPRIPSGAKSRNGQPSSDSSIPSMRAPRTSLKSPAANSEATSRRIGSTPSIPQPPSRTQSARHVSSPQTGVGGSTPGGARSFPQSRKLPRSKTTTTTSFRNSSQSLRSVDSRQVSTSIAEQTALVRPSGDPSPTLSRSSSSAHDSLSTTATVLDDDDGCVRSAQGDANEMKTSKEKSKKESKGNVLVSVRVRPESGKAELARLEGEWYVDGRKSFVSYRGKDGGDYHY
ncbi:hypothetical protein KEM55_000046, partial [Ascosphaera atra]